jgi:hypothetical protein
VRHRWVKTLAARKTAPKGAAQFIATSLARDAYMLTNPHAEDIAAAAELLGVDSGPEVRARIAALPANGDGRGGWGRTPPTGPVAAGPGRRKRLRRLHLRARQFALPALRP